MHDSHFVTRRSNPEMGMASERLRAMKTSAQRAVTGRGPPSSSSSSASVAPKSTCLCAPTSHPGSFRCRMHRSQSVPPSRQCADQGSVSRPRSLPKPQQLVQSYTPPSPTLRTCSRCLVRGPSRLSRVVYATGKEESLYDEEPEIANIPIPLPVVRLSNSSVHSRGISSAAIGARFCALRRLQGSGKDDIFRIVRPTNPRPILLST